jgi:hypothetical protein
VAINFYPFTALIGGGAGALDKEDGAGLADGDGAMVITDAGVYWYHLNATSAATENSPFRISPDANAGNKRWHLVGTTVAIGALVYPSSNQSLSSSSVQETLVFNTESYDVGDFHDNSTNNSRFTIPIGVTKVLVSGCVAMLGSFVGMQDVYIGKGGIRFIGSPEHHHDAGYNNPKVTVNSGVLSVSATNYFELYIYKAATGTSEAARTWFSIQAVEFA